MADIAAPGEIVSVSKSPGYIILSYVVSYVGCLTALELLVRRTHHGGYYNWFLLGGAATAMGGVAIWSMHYIGMQAMIMGDGRSELQLYYYASYTAGSFFLPIVVVAFSFSVFSSSRKASPWRIAVAGIFCGAAICGMHYVGQIGIVSYDQIFNWGYVVASVIIAMTAATIALGIFFYLSSKWVNAFWKRAMIALLLAGAVCLMHWTAILGSTFFWKGNNDGLPPGLSKTGAVWVCGALGVSCCLVLFGLAIAIQYVRRRYIQKAQQISLALAYFAPDGRIMLNTGGHLPLNKITRNYLSYSAKDNFDVDSAPFAWMYRVSRNWSCVDGIISNMRVHIQLEQVANEDSTISAETTKQYSYASLLKELYCIAAEDLAHAVGFSITQVGFLYDRILNTGRMTPQVRLFAPATPTMTTESDIESGIRFSRTTLTRGQVMFLVRHLNNSEVTHLQTNGFSFVPLKTVTSSIAASMQITSEELRPYLDDIAAYKEMPQMLDIGVHLAMFVIKPIIGGFEILAKRIVRNQLPSIALPFQKVELWQMNLLSQFDNWEAPALLTYWTAESTRSTMSVEQSHLIYHMCDAILHLRIRVGDKIFEKARFVAKALSDPGGNGQFPGTATILAFKCVTDIHYVHPLASADAFINARLFTTQQRCYPGSSDHAVFSGRVHTEFASVTGIMDTISQQPSLGDMSSAYQPKSPTQTFFFPRFSKRAKHADSGAVMDSDDQKRNFAKNGKTPLTDLVDFCDSEEVHTGEPLRADNTSEKLLIPGLRKTSSDPLSSSMRRKARSSFGKGGGVHVSNEVHVSVADAEAPSTEMIEMGRLGTKTEIGTVKERESAVDILMALTLGGLRV